jgi:hypothetical protein
MRHLGPVLVVLVAVASAGCAQRSDGLETAPRQRPAGAPATENPSPSDSRGKIAAGQVGKVSPVPAFQGGGAGWGIAIRATGGLRHSVRLHWSGSARDAGGTARYQASGTPGMHRLEGTLYGDAGDRAMRITLQRGNCTGVDGRVRPYSVEVSVDGLAPLRGCGDLALP